MTIAKTLSTLSLAFAMIGGALVLTPSNTAAASKPKSTHISFDALKRNTTPCGKVGPSSKNCRVGEPANKHTRGCSKITQCRG